MRIAIISDIHGNFDALSALPRDYDELWVLGDLVNYGPEPSAVIEFVRSNAAIVIRGNHDHAIGWHEDPRCSPPYRRMAAATMAFTDQVLTADDKKYLATLPLSAECEIERTKFYLCHATPPDPLFGYRPKESFEWDVDVNRLPVDVLLAGHTHVPFCRSIGRKVVANPGSLGQPKTGTPDACYALWEAGRLELRAYEYPFNRTIEKLHTLGLTSDVTEQLCSALLTGGSFQVAAD